VRSIIAAAAKLAFDDLPSVHELATGAFAFLFNAIPCMAEARTHEIL